MKHNVQEMHLMTGREGEGTYHVIAHGNEKVKEELASMFHLHLHRAAPFEGRSATDDQG
jgi:hypothetical protein